MCSSDLAMLHWMLSLSTKGGKKEEEEEETQRKQPGLPPHPVPKITEAMKRRRKFVIHCTKLVVPVLSVIGVSLHVMDSIDATEPLLPLPPLFPPPSGPPPGSPQPADPAPHRGHLPYGLRFCIGRVSYHGAAPQLIWDFLLVPCPHFDPP